MPVYYEFEVSLHDIKPRIWRRFLLRKASTFADLHAAIQAAFDWEECHLWEFRSPGRRGVTLAGLPSTFDMDGETPSASKVKLSSYFGETSGAKRCVYLYDFGDGWEHDVKLRKTQSVSESFRRRLLAGDRSGPPEDSGGPFGYQRYVELLESGEDPAGDDAEELLEWLGDWQPDAFALAAQKQAFDR